ncbi:MAG: nicotinate (nicotinamide) nucleotide adenylyltransferase [Bacteroidales bacterium]|nr:nicotinate (nicotinamide) nucleotide adenylyltransferase [Bacteroidales bacterium]
MKIGVYSGSFNPVHVGHIALVDYIIAQGIVDEIWLIRSPQNPLKSSATLLSDNHREAMLELAIVGHEGLKINTIEDHLPKPNYSVNTLRALQKQHPDDEFHLIIGADNWEIFDRWREWTEIVSKFHLIIYPRPGYPYPEVDTVRYPNVQVVDAPQFDISSTEIRERYKKGELISHLVTPDVLTYINQNKLYK